MPAFEVDALTKRYGRFTAVDRLSFAVERGSVYGLLGPNGSGKTTTLACALGLLRPTSGRISVLGEPSGRLHRTRGRVGVVFDQPLLVRGLTVRGQLAYARRLFGHAGGRGIDEVLELVGITALARRAVTKLSLGQQKRLAVAGALLGAPELLVLDEPLAGLDPLGVRAFLRLVVELARDGLTIVLSSHRLHELAPVLSHAAFVLGGRVARAGALDELLSRSAHLRLAVDDAARARAVLAELDGVRMHGEQADAPAGRLDVDLGGHDPAALNRRLVEAGVLVRELTPLAASLPALFEELVEEHARAALDQGPGHEPEGHGVEGGPR